MNIPNPEVLLQFVLRIFSPLGGAVSIYLLTALCRSGSSRKVVALRRVLWLIACFGLVPYFLTWLFLSLGGPPEESGPLGMFTGMADLVFCGFFGFSFGLPLAGSIYVRIVKLDFSGCR